METVDLRSVSHAEFQGLLGQAFRLSEDAGEPIPLELVKVEPLGSADPEPGRRRPFALVFRGPEAPILPQAIYSLELESLGRLEIFLVPVGPQAGGMGYEAVFS